MKKIVIPGFVLLCLTNPHLLLAEKGPGEEKAVVVAANEKIKSESKRSQVMDIAFQLTDVSGPRLTVSPGFMRAATWAKNQLTSYGLENARLEPWGEFGKGWQQEKCYVAMTAPYYNPIIAVPKAWTGNTPGKKEIEKEVILITATDSISFVTNYKGKLKGKIVMLAVKDTLRPSFEGDGSRYSDAELEKMANAQPAAPRSNIPDTSMGRRMRNFTSARKVTELLNLEEPALILGNGRGTDGTIFVQGGGPYTKNSKVPPANVAISADEYLRIQRLLTAGIPVKIAAEVRTSFYTDDMKGYNVIAEIPGSDPVLKNEIVMVGGHLDSWQGSTGATDNAAGCAMMMEAVRLIKASGIQPKRTVRIALWSGEEQGLYGSSNWVKNNLADPTKMELKPEHSKIAAYFNLDNGTGKIRGIYCQGNKAVMPIFQEWLNNFGDSTAKTVTISTTGGTDHLSFDAVGVPGFQFIQDEIEYDTRTHHTNMDSYDHLVAADLIQASTLVASFIFNAAQSDDKLPRKELPKPRPARTF
ncbi:MAG: M20/M25/M40 family metallo-hydrolase [Bacteroidota bacterium]